MNLLERDSCLAALAGWQAAISERGGCIVLVGGEAGIGKTALLQAFSTRNAGTRVLWGACDALYTPQPLAPVHDIARQTLGALSAAVNAAASRQDIFAAALGELGGQRTVFVFEDLHWADEATLDLVKFLGRRIQRTVGMIVVTYRDDEIGPLHPLRSVIGDLPRGSTHRLVLEPLSKCAVDELARQAGRPSQDIHRLTGGNPLFVSEVLASPANAVPVTVRDAVLTRAHRLGTAARDIAEFVAMIPSKAEAWLLSSAGRDDEAGLDECLAIGMLRHDDGSLSYRHELVRRAMESSLSRARQRELHAAILEMMLTRDGISAARLAHHANGAGNSAEVLRLAPLAAEQAAAVGAHREAASHWQSAIAHSGELKPESLARLHERLSYECYLIDEIERAIRERDAALDIWRASGQKLKEGDALRWLSRLSWFAGRRADANRFAELAIAALIELPPGAELAMAYSNRSQLDMLAYETDSAILWADRAIALAQALGDNEILCHALNNRGTARQSGGDPGGWDDLTRSLELALAGGYQEHVARAYTNLASQAVSGRRYDRAAQSLAKGIAYCHDNDLDSWRVYMLAWSARAKFEVCDWLAAGEEAQHALRHTNAAPVSRIPALTVLGHMRIRRGDPDAEAPLREALTLAAPTGELQRLGPIALAQAESKWLKDDLVGVLEALKQVYDMAQRHREPWIKGELAVWLRRAGGLENVPQGIAEPYALEIAGHWQDAASAWRTIGCPYERALVLGWHGEEPEQREALTILQDLGATPACEALRRRMRSMGVRGVPRGARPSTEQHSLGLTRREAQILDLMSSGLRNAAIAKRVFLSTRTVDHHVSAILTKLGVNSRAAAIEIARRAPEFQG